MVFSNAVFLLVFLPIVLLGYYLLHRSFQFAEVVLPIGISFFTFQGLSYVVDVALMCTCKIKADTHTFVSVCFYFTGAE